MSHIILIAVAVVVSLFLFITFIRKRKRHHYPESSQLYIGNLSYHVNAHHLREFFSQYGELKSARLIKNTRTGRSKGFAFITYHHVQDAKNALKANGKEMRGRTIVVRMAKPRDSE